MKYLFALIVFFPFLAACDSKSEAVESIGSYNEWPFELAGGNIRTWDLYTVYKATSSLDTTSKQYVLTQRLIYPNFEDNHLTVKSDSTYSMSESLANFLEVPKSGKVIFNLSNIPGRRSFKIGELELIVDNLRIQQGPQTSYWIISMTSTQLFDNDKQKRDISIYGKYLIL